MSREMLIVLDSRVYEHEDDCLAAAADDVRRVLGLRGWLLDERLGNDSRETIEVTVPMPDHNDARGWDRLRALHCISCSEIKA